VEAYLRRSEAEGEGGNGGMYGCQLRKRTVVHDIGIGEFQGLKQA
jgi:hypothetical protein